MIDHPRKNRVTPFGEFEAVPEKGMFLGNRGDIHAPDGGPGNRRWAVRAWICCTLSPKSGNRISFDRKGIYYPLFFVDEVTAFAAGHRPCAMCRYQDYQRFKRCWQKASERSEDQFISAIDIDRELQISRVDKSRRKIIWQAVIDGLPDGTIITPIDSPKTPQLLWRGKTFAWSQAGYSDARPVLRDDLVNVLTPRPIVDVLRAGYAPVVHSSAL